MQGGGEKEEKKQKEGQEEEEEVNEGKGRKREKGREYSTSSSCLMGSGTPRIISFLIDLNLSK